jgi:hypothetical protein
MAKVTITFDKKHNDKKYTYDFPYPSNPTKHNLAMAISKAMMGKAKKTKFIGLPRSYALVSELLNQKSTHIHFNPSETIDLKKDAFIDANNRNIEEKGVKVQCCNNPACENCKGSGYFYERLMWRVGVSQSHVMIIDVDGRDIENAKYVKAFYEKVLNCKFTLIKSNKGYWLLSDMKYKSVNEWKYDHCKVLNPSLEPSCMDDYIKDLLLLDKDKNGEFLKSSTEKIKESGLYSGHGDFDIMFTFLSIKRELSTLRISKKRKTDSIEVLP